MMSFSVDLFKMEILLFINILVLPVFVFSAPQIDAPWGRIAGVDKVSRDGILYYGYYGIRYAKPPLGELRFNKPVPHPGVSGVFNASSYGPKCLQLTQVTYKNVDNPDMDEDCLTLNVFLPNSTQGSSPKSVMFWIHGGGFVWGDATQYKPWMLVTKGDVIVVVIQYRLGVFGFLSTGSDAAPGNYGLWDQHLALKWVKENIQAFGGDKDNITIIGESAGAASVAYHVLYPGSKGLFSRAVLQSGAATSLWASARYPSQTAVYLGYIMGCLNNDTRERMREEAMIECLRSKDSRTIVTYGLMGGTMAYELMGSPWTPAVDGDFVKDSPGKMMKDGKFLNTTCMSDIDVMVGINNNEGSYMLYLAFSYDAVLNYTFAKDLFKQSAYDNDILTTSLALSLGEHDPKINDIVNAAYTYPRPSADIPLPHLQVFDTYADPGFVAPAIQFARSHANTASSKECYFYFFNHYPSFTGDNPIKGIMHGLDTAYLFNLSPGTVKYFGNTGNITQAEYELSDTFAEFIAEFAKSGDPNVIIQPKLGQRWPPYELPDGKYLSFTTNMSVGSDVYDKRVSLWLDIIPYLVDMWRQPVTTTLPNVPTTTYTPRWFYMDQHTAEITILILIVVLVVVAVILLSLIVCWCVRNKKTPRQKYAMR